MSVTNLMDLQPEGPVRKPELVRLGNNETAVIPYTMDVNTVEIHYVECPSISSYVQCNGIDCDLCKIGNYKATRLLLPVFDPVGRKMAVLPIGDSIKPGSLAPQITRETAEAQKNGGKRVLFISRMNNNTFAVRSSELPDTVDDGASQIKEFIEMQNHGEFELASVYPSYSNQELRKIDDIREQLKLRGLL